MNRIDALERQIATRTQTSSTSLLTAYMNTQRAGNKLLDFGEGLYDSDVPGILDELKEHGILDELKEHGIGEFTISANQTGLTTIIWNLTQAGATLTGMTQVNDRYPDPFTDQRHLIPAWHLTIQ